MKNKQLWHFGVYLLVGLGIGLVLGVLSIPISQFFLVYIPMALVLLVGIVIFHLFYFHRYDKEVRKALELLEQLEPQQALDHLMPLFEKAKGRYLRSVLAIDLSACYCDLRKYAQAIEILKQNPCRNLTPMTKVVYQLNLCLCYCYTGQRELAFETFENFKKDAARYSNSKALGGSIAVLQILILIEQGNYDLAQAQLEQAREQWNFPRIAEEYRCVEQRLLAYREGQPQEQ